MHHVEEILIVRHNGNLFGINTDTIEHILRVLDITPLPFAPKEVRGFCSVEGSILTVLDLSLLLLEDTPIDETVDSARLISASINDRRYSILLEEVINNVGVDQNEIEYIAEEDFKRDGVVAAYKYNGDIIQVLDLARLVSNIKALTFQKREFSDKYEEGNKKELLESKTNRYFLFMMGNEQYAIDVNRIREVITVPDTFTNIADSGPETLGMITLREEIVVIIDLRYIYELPIKKGPENRIIIVQLGHKIVGLYIDSIVDIADFADTDIDMMPENFRDDKISGIAHKDNGLISLVNVDAIATLLNHVSGIEGMTEDEVGEESVAVERENFTEIVSFYLDGKCYALQTHEVVEIIDAFEITSVSDMPESVQGITNIRGKVIPVVSLYDKLDLKRSESSGKRMLVCQYEGDDIGLLVDEVKDVSNISRDLFLPEEESVYFNEIIKVDDKSVILMINLEKLLG
jgi:purine-binding chemotaxis protein CheW